MKLDELIKKRSPSETVRSFLRAIPDDEAYSVPELSDKLGISIATARRVCRDLERKKKLFSAIIPCYTGSLSVFGSSKAIARLKKERGIE
jgi:diaminopimelate decarboxylase